MRLDRTTCPRCGADCDGHDLPADSDGPCPACREPLFKRKRRAPVREPAAARLTVDAPEPPEKRGDEP